MVTQIENGKCHNWNPELIRNDSIEEQMEQAVENIQEEIDPRHLQSRSSSWEQFKILYSRRIKQMCRDSVRNYKLYFSKFNFLFFSCRVT